MKYSNTVIVSESGEIDLKEFNNFLDISKIAYYSVKEKDGIIVLKFYDKKKKLIKTRRKNNEKDK